MTESGRIDCYLLSYKECNLLWKIRNNRTKHAQTLLRCCVSAEIQWKGVVIAKCEFKKIYFSTFVVFKNTCFLKLNFMASIFSSIKTSIYILRVVFSMLDAHGVHPSVWCANYDHAVRHEFRFLCYKWPTETGDPLDSQCFRETDTLKIEWQSNQINIQI